MELEEMYPPDMEEPTPCPCCGRWVELQSMKQATDRTLMCKRCIKDYEKQYREEMP